MKNICTFFLVLIPAISFSQTHWEASVLADNTWRYLEPTAQPPITWKNVGFNDNSWSTGSGGIGYGDGDDNTVVAAAVSIYLRMEFNVVDPAVISDILLEMDFDDGYIAYLNGLEIARSATMNSVGGNPAYTDISDGEHEAVMYNGGLPEETDVDINLLLTGTNCLAIEIHNWATNSSDMSAIPFLFFHITDASSDYQTTPTWFIPPAEEFATELPLVLIETNGQSIPNNMGIIAQMGVVDNGPGNLNSADDAPNAYNGRISIEVRGSSSQMFPKKQYEIETQDLGGAAMNVPLMGMPSDNDWILYAPYSDKSLMRNVLTYNLATEMGMPASRTRYCEVMINGDYKGIFVLLEKIKWGSDRVDVEKMDENDNSGDALTGGYLIKVDKETGSGTLADWWSDITFYEVAKEYGFQYDRPHRDLITQQQEGYIQDHINTMEAVLNSVQLSDPELGYRHYFDLPTTVDFLLLNEFTRNIDAYRLSTYLGKQRDSRGGKIVVGPIWDINLGYSNANYCDGENTEGWAFENCERDETPIWWEAMLTDPEFLHLVSCRWQQLRSEILDETKLFDQMDAYTAELGPAINRNYLRWPILGTWIWPNPFLANTHAEHVEYMKGFITARLEWMDDNIPAPTSACNSGIENTVIVSEISYNQGNTDLSEDWFELHNTTSTNIDLSLVTVQDNNVYNSFTFPIGTQLLADSFLVIARDLDVFSAVHPTVTNVVQGSFNWGLSNSEDRIRMRDVNGLPILDITYSNQTPWPAMANGQGPTMEYDLSQSDQSDGNNWFEGCVGGSPGMGYVDCNVGVQELTTSAFSISPTLTDGPLKIQLFFSQPENVDLRITDATGRMVHVINKMFGAGRHQLSLNLNQLNLENGVYLISLKTEDSFGIKRVVLGR